MFAAFATEAGKAKWFGGPPEQWAELRRQFDFRVGGREHASGRRAQTGVTSHFDCLYWDIVPDERIVYTYEMHLDDRKISVSLATIELKAVDGGTRLIVTEQGAFLDGYDDAGSREHGTNFLMDRMGATLD